MIIPLVINLWQAGTLQLAIPISITWESNE